ncbi:MAG: hypothetical protein IE933_07805 [Sphingomonadales bacterium]|nr:hypothetical protein [Sphingomonadales bacterium]MBD3773789.1 hypothetical protein [Paracoccaceae bacterium]
MSTAMGAFTIGTRLVFLAQRGIAYSLGAGIVFMPQSILAEGEAGGAHYPRMAASLPTAATQAMEGKAHFGSPAGPKTKRTAAGKRSAALDAVQVVDADFSALSGGDIDQADGQKYTFVSDGSKPLFTNNVNNFVLASPSPGLATVTIDGQILPASPRVPMPAESQLDALATSTAKLSRTRDAPPATAPGLSVGTKATCRASCQSASLVLESPLAMPLTIAAPVAVTGEPGVEASGLAAARRLPIVTDASPVVREIDASLAVPTGSDALAIDVEPREQPSAPTGTNGDQAMLAPVSRALVQPVGQDRALAAAIEQPLAMPEPLQLAVPVSTVAASDFTAAPSIQARPVPVRTADLAASRKSAATSATPLLGLAKIDFSLDRVDLPSDHLAFSKNVQFNGRDLGKLPIFLTSGDGIMVKLSDLVNLLQDQWSPEVFAQMASSPAAKRYMTLDELRAWGIDLRYDAARDQLRFLPVS